MRDSTAETAVDPPTGSTTGGGSEPSSTRIEPAEFQQWVVSNRERITSRWFSTVTNRLERQSKSVFPLLQRFYETFVSIVPESLGPYREQVEPIWRQTAKLYGEFGAKRGLAAGEIIEEFQILREAFIRIVYGSPPIASGSVLSLREVLRLNRLVDRGVTHASIGYTDALFFALLEGPGAAESVTPELVAEVQDQLEQIRADFDEVMRSLPG